MMPSRNQVENGCDNAVNPDILASTVILRFAKPPPANGVLVPSCYASSVFLWIFTIRSLNLVHVRVWAMSGETPESATYRLGHIAATTDHALSHAFVPSHVLNL